MDFINARDLAPPVLPFERVDCEALGGAVKVRSLGLAERRVFQRTVERLREEQYGSEEAARLATHKGDGEVVVYKAMAHLLAATVVDGADQPVYSVAGWNTFGRLHESTVFELFDIAWRISGLSGDEAKKN